MNEWYSDWLLRRGEVSSSLADTLEQAIRSGRLAAGHATADAPGPLEAPGRRGQHGLAGLCGGQRGAA